MHYCSLGGGLRDLVDSELFVTPMHEPPSTLEKVKNFAGSAARHVAAGMPRATDEEVERRYAICQGCEFLKNDACTKCGCPIVRRKKFISKLSWADQKCPIGKW